MFYNTTSETGEQLKIFRQKVKDQDAEVLDVFKLYRYPLAPHQVQQLSRRLKHAPLTSVRRAITELTKEGFLRKTDIKRDGPYGRPAHCWELNSCT